MTAMIVHVDMNPRGVWEVEVPERPSRVACESLADAQRVGHQWAERRHPCELVIRDAYHRVLSREFIESAGDVESPSLDR
jgi:hypothetical protein